MIELRLLRSSQTKTKPDQLQYRTFDQVEGWTHSEWSQWKKVPIVIEGAETANHPSTSNGPAPLESGGSVIFPEGLVVGPSV